MTHYLGIDSAEGVFRLCIIDNDLKKLAYVERKQAGDLRHLGRPLAGELIVSAVEAVVEYAYLEPEQITAVAVAVTGHGEGPWLKTILGRVLTDAQTIATTTDEITLLGANNERYGVLLYAGEASRAYAVNRAGEAGQVGGWGPLIGGEGSDYWLGAQALRAVSHAADGRGLSTILTDIVLETYGLNTPRDIPTWVEGHSADGEAKRIRSVAALVLKAAEGGDEVARKLIEQAAAHLGAHYRAVQLRLGMQAAPVFFAGKLLDRDTPLRTSVMATLGIREVPKPQHDPVTGAAMLARLANRRDVPA